MSTCISDGPVATSDIQTANESTQPRRNSPPARVRPLTGRVEYSVWRDGYPIHVIADFFPDGREDFAEQEPFEVCWFPHDPSEQERAFVLEQLTQNSRIAKD